MKNIWIALAVALLAWSIFPASAAQMDGNGLWDNCNQPNAEFGQGLCFGYIAGIAQMVTFENIEGSTYFWKSCPPGGVTYRQYVDVVKKFLLEHPEDRHRPASLLVLMALGVHISAHLSPRDRRPDRPLST